VIIGGLLALALLVFVVLPRVRREDEGTPGPPVQEVYAQVADAMRRDGMVALVTELCESEDPVACRTTTKRHWIDGSAGVARTESTFRNTQGDVTDVRIILDGVEHSISGNDRAPIELAVGCVSERPAWLSMYGACYSFAPAIVPETRSGVRFDGRDALMIR
jgi:hypothetical protein